MDIEPCLRACHLALPELPLLCVLRLQGMRSQLEKAFGPAQPPSEAEVAAAVREIVAADAMQQQQQPPPPQLAGGPVAAPLAAPPLKAQLGSPGSVMQVRSDGLANVEAASDGAVAAALPGPLLVCRVGPSGRGGRQGLAAAAASLSQLD